MSAEASAGTNPRLTLDHSSFERLLAAAWVLQCLQDQLHPPQLNREETIVEPVKVQRETDTLNPSLHVAMKPALQFSPERMDADVRHVSLSTQPADIITPAEPVDALPALKTGTLHFDPVVKLELKTAEPKSLPAEDKARPRVKPVVPNLVKARDKEWTLREAAFNLRTAFERAHNVFNNALPRVRVHLTLGGLRALAVATPVWVLSFVAALLFLEVWRHGSFQSAQAISRPNPPAVEAVVNSISTIPSPTNPPVSEEIKRTAKERRPPRDIAPLEGSHQRITDPATLSAVQQLSRYEIKGLRRRAKYGEESAAFTLGMAYEVGHSVPQNCVEAARWVMTAAEAGDAAAQYNLGLRYREGDGVPANRTESVRWLRKAASHRNQPAKLALQMLASR
jgi:hypothetical protein